jgi:hypothetical protein
MRNAFGDLGFLAAERILQPIASVTSTTNGTAISTSDLVGPLNILAVSGAATGTGSTFTVTLQESATSNGTFTDVPDGTVAVFTETTDDTVVAKLINRTTLPWVRTRIVVAGANSPTASLFVLLQGQLINAGFSGGFNVTNS